MMHRNIKRLDLRLPHFLFLPTLLFGFIAICFLSIPFLIVIAAGLCCFSPFAVIPFVLFGLIACYFLAFNLIPLLLVSLALFYFFRFSPIFFILLTLASCYFFPLFILILAPLLVFKFFLD